MQYKIPAYNVGGTPLTKKQMMDIKHYLKEQKLIKKLEEEYGVSDEEAKEFASNLEENYSDETINEMLDESGITPVVDEEAYEYEIPEYLIKVKDKNISISVAEMEDISEYISIQLIIATISAKRSNLPSQEMHDIAMSAYEMMLAAPERLEEDIIEEALDNYFEEQGGAGGDYGDDSFGYEDGYYGGDGGDDDNDDY